jgi:DcmR-like sensory protein
MSTRTSGGYVHHALFYDSTEALLTGAVPFLRAGLDGGEDVVLVCRERNNALLAFLAHAHEKAAVHSYRPRPGL